MSDICELLSSHNDNWKYTVETNEYSIAEVRSTFVTMHQRKNGGIMERCEDALGHCKKKLLLRNFMSEKE